MTAGGSAPRVLVVLVGLGLALACAPEQEGPALRADGRRLVDERGREVLLRGVNARIEGLFDVSLDGGRAPLEPIPSFGGDDLRFLRDEVGFNALRIPINWSGLQPTGPGDLDAGYLDQLHALLDECAAVEMWCLVDLHQDAYSKEIGEDGAPLWAIVPAPDELLEGPLEDLEARRVSPQVLRAFDTFFSGLGGVQDAYLDMLAALTADLKGRPWVAGLEVFNEPVGDELAILGFAERATEAVHAVDPDRLVLWEPTALRNLQDTANTDGGLHLDNDAYAPHLYPEVFSGEGNLWANGDPARLAASTAAARREADAHDAPLIVTEFGIDPTSTRGLAWIERMEAEMDAARASRFFWVYEELSQGRWGLFDDGRVLREPLVDLLARAAPEHVAGTILDLTVDDHALRVRLEGGGVHVLSAPPRAFRDGVRATCDGVDVEARRRGTRVEVACGDGALHELVLAPR